MRGLFDLARQAIRTTPRAAADRAGVDLRSLDGDTAYPTLRCVVGVGSLVGLTAAQSCAVVSIETEVGRGDLRRVVASADAYDDIRALRRLAMVVESTPGHSLELGVAACIEARVAAADGATESVGPLLSFARSIGVPRAWSRVARHLARQARIDAALGAPWAPSPPLPALVSRPVVAVARSGVRRALSRWLGPAAGPRCVGRGATASGVEILRLLLDGSEAMGSGRAAQVARIWRFALGGLVAIRVLEHAEAARDVDAAHRATRAAIRSQLALEAIARRARGRLASLAASRRDRILIAEWALRLRLGELAPDATEVEEQRELAALFHRFPRARAGPLASWWRDRSNDVSFRTSS